MSSATLNPRTVSVEQPGGGRGATELSIAITRLVDGSPAEVFEAWLAPKHLAQWWGPRDGTIDFTTPHVSTDPRVGGKYRIAIRSPRDGAEYWAGGTYLQLDNPNRLVLSFAWEPINGQPTGDRTITVDFAPSGEKTVVAFRIDGFASVEDRDSEIEGWNECLDRLVRYFSAAALRSRADDERQLRALTDAWSRALERKDAAGLTADYTPDALLYDAIPPFQTRGPGAIRAVWEQCLPCLPATFQSERRDVQFVVGGDVAFMHGLHHFKMDDPDPAAQSWLRTTVCYQRVDGHWKVAHEHVSLPFDPMTGDAVYITDADVQQAK
jgi:uncharacterized protein (TIGR02246 family)